MLKWYLAVLGIALAALIAAWTLHGETDARPAAMTAAADDVACTVVRPPTRLPPLVRETSGLAHDGSGVLWTHNDAGGEPEIYGFDGTGRQLARVAVTGAAFTDWEDIDAGPCGDARCLYIADIGDNDGGREHVTIYRVPEPGTSASEIPATAIHARYPDGPQDAEALIALPDGTLLIITKGEHGPVRLYRLPPGAEPGVSHRLQLVRELAPQPGSRRDRVTAATASRDGRWIAYRTYDSLVFHEAASLIDPAVAAGAPARFDLRSLNEPQGEGLALDADGGVWLTSEAEGGGEPFLTALTCPYEP